MIPTYEEIMHPLLEHCKDGKSIMMKEIIESLADHFNLTEEERQEKLPSKNARVFYDRAQWAKTYLKKAG